MGSWHRPEIQLFLTRGNPGGTCPAICGRPGRAGPAYKLRLKYQGELTASHFLPKGRNCPADHETKNRKALTRHACTEMHFGYQLSRTIMQGCERSGCGMLNAVCRHWIQGNSAPGTANTGKVSLPPLILEEAAGSGSVLV